MRFRAWRIVRRAEPLNWGSFLLFGVALTVSLTVCAGMLVIQGKPGLLGIGLLLQGGFGDEYALGDTLIKAIPIFLCAAGVALCFRMQVWNIGAEGQYILGAVGATAMVLAFPDAPAWVMLPGMFLGAVIAGGLWAFIPAGLRLFCGMNEIISSLMLNYIAIDVLRYLIYGPWKDPDGSGFAHTFVFPDAAIVPSLFGRVHWGLAVCFVVGALLSYFFKRTRLGYEIIVGGENPRAALYAGMPYAFMVAFVLCVCGGLAGLAGGLETSAMLNRLSDSATTAQYGYTAIVVAWLARLRISRIAFFAFLLAGLRVGVGNLELELAVPAAFSRVIEGCILITVLALQFFDVYTLRRKPAGQPPVPVDGDLVAAADTPTVINAAAVVLQRVTDPALPEPAPEAENATTQHGATAVEQQEKDLSPDTLQNKVGGKAGGAQ